MPEAKWLRYKIVRTRMNNHGFPDDLRNAKSIGCKNQQCASVYAKQRRHIAGMIRMRAVVRVQMHPRIGKRIGRSSGACLPAVNVECKNRVFAWRIILRQPADFRPHQHGIGHREYRGIYRCLEPAPPPPRAA